jgi:hypothetical protein
MSVRLRAVAPLAFAVALIAFAWCEIALNASFHWLTVSDGVFGKLGLPESFHFVLPASFITWGLFFVLGAADGGLRRTLVAAATGTLAAIVVMVVGPALADAPDFWGLAIAVAVAGAGLVLLSATRDDDLLAPAPAFACGGAVLLWWFATGLDNYIPDGKGPHTVAALVAALTKTPLAAGTGAFGGLMSTSWLWAAVSASVSLAIGAVLGLASLALTGALVRAPRPIQTLEPHA